MKWVLLVFGVIACMSTPRFTTIMLSRLAGAIWGIRSSIYRVQLNEDDFVVLDAKVIFGLIL